MFNSYLEKNYRLYFDLYTDGSKITDTDTSVASGLYIPLLGYTANWKLHPDHTVMGSELYAIYKALEFIDKNLACECVIFTDSMSSLQLLMSNKKHYMIITEQICRLLYKLNETRPVILHWIKAHVEITGNEIADTLANSGHSKDTSMIYPIEREEILSQINHQFIAYWDRYWHEECYITEKGLYHRRKVRDSLRTMTPVDSKNRRIDVALFRLRLGHAGVNKHMNRFNMKETSKCEVCDCEETIEHYLLTCPRYHQQRREMIGQINMHVENGERITLKLLLGGEEKYHSKNTAILNSVGRYLSRTGRLSTI